MNVIVITGASSGMGREFVFAMDREFAPDEIWVIARREDKLKELGAKCRAKVRPIVLDLKDRAGFCVYADPVRMQVRAVKHLPVSLVMRTWCRQQGK